MRAGWAAVWGLVVAMGAGCKSEPLPDDRANDTLESCCSEARERVTSIKDVETDRFRESCGACKQGNSKRECASGAAKVQEAVRQAYGNEVLPVSCTTLKSSLAELGVDVPSMR